MSRVRLFHWKAAEAEALCNVMREAGLTVEYSVRPDPQEFRAIRQSPPDAFVIDLTRLPSHGREVATFLRGQKSTREIPLLFVDGVRERVEAIRNLLPDADYVRFTELPAAVRKAAKKRLADPVVPAQMMERYAARSTAQKLGIQDGSTVALIDPPMNYAAALGHLPARVTLEEAPGKPRDITLWFVHDAAGCAQALPAMRKLAASTKLWILWRKRTEVTQQFLRESAAAVGLVDYKICSVDRTWSGMLLARKKG